MTRVEKLVEDPQCLASAWLLKMVSVDDRGGGWIIERPGWALIQGISTREDYLAAAVYRGFCLTFQIHSYAQKACTPSACRGTVEGNEMLHTT